MVNLADQDSLMRHRVAALPLVIILILTGVLYLADSANNPPGFYIDESSISYNAHLISTTGRDEYGEAWPLYFRAFGDYKNPTYIYLLAAVFRMTGPGIAVARLLSATLGLMCGLLVSLLAWRMTARIIVALIVAISALLTPWLYESSRLVFEVSIYPLLIVLFLLALYRASSKPSWKIIEIMSLAATLALLTYSYSIGRLLGPLLAVGLTFFVTRRRWPSVLKTWVIYAFTLIPLFVFHLRNPDALSNRFRLLTYVTPQSSLGDIARQFIWHYAGNVNPWRWFATGENNIRDHVPGHGSLLAVTIIFGVTGFVLVCRNHWREPWWRFILYGLAVSIVPASLTRGEFPQLRLIAFPVFFHVLTIPALAWLCEIGERSAAGDNVASHKPFEPAQRIAIPDGSVWWEWSLRTVKRVTLVTAVGLIVLQGAYFQWGFHKTAATRWHVFDARFPRRVLSVALAMGKKPIYLVDAPGNSGYIQAYWYSILRGMNTTQFVRLPMGTPPPPGALVISSAEDCDNCKLIAKSINYIVYAVPPYEPVIEVAELPADAFRAQISSNDVPPTLKVGGKATLNVLVKNLGGETWPAVGEAGYSHAVVLRDRWLRLDGTVVNDQDARARFPFDLEPGDTAGVSLQITGPKIPAEYLLELDVVQEGVAWFGERGSETLKRRLTVER